MRVRPIQRADRSAWLQMRRALWPDALPDGLAAEVDRFFMGTLLEPEAVLVAERHGRLVGFAELSVRPFAEGCRAGRVAYLEGWWVAPDIRRKGVGRALIHASELWARDQGCTEFASDSSLDNPDSRDAHLALGFRETGRLVCFAKRLD